MVSEFLIRSQISSMIAALRVSLALLNAALERECNLFLSEIVLSLSTNSTLYCVTSLGKNLGCQSYTKCLAIKSPIYSGFLISLVVPKK